MVPSVCVCSCPASEELPSGPPAPGVLVESIRGGARPCGPKVGVPDRPRDALSNAPGRSRVPLLSAEKKTLEGRDSPTRQSFRPRQCPRGADFERPREGMNAKTSHVEVALYCLLGCATASSIGALIELQPPNSDQRSNACVLQVTWLLLRNECGVSDACCE